MTQYTTKPQTVEAMQWLGPDDPAHVAEFENWANGAEPAGNYRVEKWEEKWLFACQHWQLLLPLHGFVVKENGGFSTYHPDDFHARYTPVKVGAKS